MQSDRDSLKDRNLRPWQRFVQQEALGGIVLFVAAAVAMLLANSPLREAFHGFWQMPAGLHWGDWSLQKPLLVWVNDLLMAVFFLVIGLEIKRELLAGELSSMRQAMLPLLGAIGGMLLPAAIYFCLNSSGTGARGWGIPMATDIAFALGILILAGRRVPSSLRVFLLALAIFDDLGAILVIAIFYSHEMNLAMLCVAAGVWAVMLAMNALGVRRLGLYGALGLVLWYFMLKSGVHATIAGVLTAIAVPATSRLRTSAFVDVARNLVNELADSGKRLKGMMLNERQDGLIRALESEAEQYGTPLQRLENAIHPWAAFVVMPVFALANAGIAISSSEISAVAMGVFWGLVVGKPVGILLFCWIGVRLRLAVLPAAVTWSMMLSIGLLAGVGFTMSLFISGLAFPGLALDSQAKLGIVAGSATSGIAGFLALRASTKRSMASSQHIE